MYFDIFIIQVIIKLRLRLAHYINISTTVSLFTINLYNKNCYLNL